MTVHFSDVGRDKKSWSSEVESLSDATLTREIRRQAALMSREVEYSWNDDGDQARIIVGMVRTVGRLKVENGAKLA